MTEIQAILACKNCEQTPIHALDLCESCYGQSIIVTGANGQESSAYTPQPHQMPWHASNAPNLLALGTRDTGKSKQMRWDVITRCLLFPGFKALIIRRKMPDLRKSHLMFINADCRSIGCARFRETTFDVKFDNDSFIQFSHCYDEQTEVLTRRGFVRFGELTNDDEIASREMNGCLRYDRPIERQKRRFDGTAIRIKSSSVDLLVTPDHPVMCWNHRDEEVVFDASTAFSRAHGRRPIHFKRTATWGGTEQAHYTPIPMLSVPMDDWLFFLGWFLSEGHTSHVRIRNQFNGYSVSIAQKKQPEVIDQIAALWCEWGLKSSICQRADGVRVIKGASVLYPTLSLFGKSHEKFVPDYVKELSPRQILIFLTALFEGDGTIRDGKWILYTTTSKRLADDVQELLLKAGMVGTVTMRQTTPSHKNSVYSVVISHSRINPSFRPAMVSEEPYHGFMYDVTMPHSPTLLIRRNGRILWGHNCEHIKDVENYLSSQWDYVGFDELSSFPLEMFLQVSVAARTEPNKPYKALVRACSNPLGAGAGWMKQWFIDKNVNLGEYPDYHPDDFEMQFSTMDDNRYADPNNKARLQNLPDHVRRAWLYGEFVIEGAYFTDFRKLNDKGEPWHVIKTLPTWKGQHLLDLPWVSIYRAVDWGYFPDPWVCLWIAVLPNKWAIVFKERSGKRMLAADVAKQIHRESAGMRVVDTMCDPTMFVKDGAAPFSIGDIFEQNGVPLTAAQNDRELYGYSINEHLNTVIDGVPMGRIVESACPNLVRTLPMMQMDTSDTRKLANGDDHWVVAWAYFCMGRATPTYEPDKSLVRKWMRPKSHRRAA